MKYSAPPTTKHKNVVIIGAGPAGLTAAYKLSEAGVSSVVLEKDDVVGGISRTAKYKGYHFDIGGHRFFTKVPAVDELWREIMPNGDFLRRSRMSRIYYNRKFFFYPLHAANALWGLGPWNSFLIALSYLKVKIAPVHPVETLEHYIINHFGERLYKIFFKTYTEKVWGIPCDDISAEWGAQRIKGLSLKTAVKNYFLQRGDGGEIIKTLIDSFHYPRLGPGMMWETLARKVASGHGEVRLRTQVEKVYWSESGVVAVETTVDGHRERHEGTHFISSMPVRELIQKLDPPPPPEVASAAENLNYRDFLTVALIIQKRNVFPDNWIYIHDSNIKMGRIQNFKNWSPDMVPDENMTCLGLEYFCFEGDGLWTMEDADLIALGKRELEQLGLACAEDVVDGSVVRMAKAYPVYDAGYAQALSVVREFLTHLGNFQTVGRNGMHKYNNQDHSMLTAMLAVKNIMGANHDIWAVNADQEYHEEIRSGEENQPGELALLAATQPKVPQRKSTTPTA